MKLRYFTKDEINFVSFGCEDGYDRMSIKALIMFDNLRHQLGFSLNPTAAFRTKEFDKMQGRSGTGRHTKGIAMDFHCPNDGVRGEIITKALELGFRGIGVGKTFVHIDCREGDLKIWGY